MLTQISVIRLKIDFLVIKIRLLLTYLLIMNEL